MTQQQYEAYTQRRAAALMAARQQGAIAQQPARNEPLAQAQAEEGDTSRCLVRVTSYRSRLLDEDNLVAKYHIDALRYAGVLASDAPQHTHIECRQVKVHKGQTEGTLIEVIHGGPPTTKG
jgi:hypothetical protein